MTCRQGEVDEPGLHADAGRAMRAWSHGSTHETLNELADDGTHVLRARLQGQTTVRHVGRVVRAIGTGLRVSGLPARIGQRCEIVDQGTGKRLLADVVGVDCGDALLVPLGGLTGVAVNSTVQVIAETATVPVGDALLGRVVDGFGVALDGAALPLGMHRRPLISDAPGPLSRARVNRVLQTGVRAIDTLLSVGVGQRLGIFAPAGAGKSTLLGMLAANVETDVVVIALVGERGREVREFLEDCLDADTRSRAIVVAATSDRPAAERVAAANTATAIAESFREQGKRVLLLIDSITRFARAIREIGLGVGEPPVRQGFTPSVFAELPRLFERSGNDAAGSITAFYTVLTDDEQGIDPVAEETRSILDGHIVLSRKLGDQGHYPAIDVLASISRLASALNDERQSADSLRTRALIARYRDLEFLLQVGEYKPGTDTAADEAVRLAPAIDRFLRQPATDSTSVNEAWEQLHELLNEPAPVTVPRR